MKAMRAQATVHPTRYPELGYRQDDAALWRIYALDGERAIGPFYRSKAELLGDLARYAAEYGCTT